MKLLNKSGINNRPAMKICCTALWIVVGIVPGITSASVLEEIIVTAQKREQSLQDVSTAVTAFSAERLSDANITDIEGLQYYVPSITIGNTFGYANLFIRGLGLNTVFANVDPSVALYVDGAIISQPGAQLFSFFDLQRVEVLRGPQGTLYGRNATGGTINLITVKPTEDNEGYVRFTGGDYGLFQSEAAVGGAISDRVWGRFAFQTINRNGYSTNQVTGNDVDDADRKAFRGQLLFKASDSVDVLLAAEYGTEKDAANGFYFKRETFPGSTKPGAIAPGIGGFPFGDRGFASNVDPENDRETWSITGTLDWNINENWSLKNILNYRDTNLVNFQDLDGSAIVNSSVQEFVFDSQHYSEELQLIYDNDRIHAIGGFYYFNEDLLNLNRIDTLKIGGSFANGTEKRVNLRGNAETESWALYWNAIYNITEKLAVRAGGRYTNDDRNIVNNNVIWVAGGRVRLSPENGNLPLFTDADSFSDYTNEFGIEWRPSEDVLLYYTYSEGFKAGTGQIGANAANIIKPETIKNHEFGLKSTWLDGSLYFNVSAYFYEVKDLQLDRTLPGGPTGFITIFENATSQDANGVELEAFWAPTDRLRLSAFVAYQDTEFGSFTSADPTDERNIGGVFLVDIKGNAARQAPEWAWTTHGEYDFPLQNDGLITLSADASYKDDQFFSEFNNSLLFQKAYTIFDARLRYTPPNGNWTAEVWGKNLTDELVEAGNFALATGRVVTRTFLPPRTWGITVAYTF